MNDSRRNLDDELGRDLRDRFFALSRDDAGAQPDALDRFRARVAAIQVEPTLELDGLALCYHPSARFKVVLYPSGTLHRKVREARCEIEVPLR